MNPQSLIRKKRDGGRFSREEIAAFVAGVCDGSWTDYQISALLMAMFLNELSTEEGAALTREMLDSGEKLDFSDLGGPVADKHSTGGVGDKTSLLIAPMVAACGVYVPMISGRGLGHTGGTLDKLESIPGYNVNLELEEFKGIVRKNGFAMTGQTAEIAPADKKLYALRDATSTVESVPLIVASIMSKKMAEGLQALVLDVKCGSGAFMPNMEQTRRLARGLVITGNKFGVHTKALITDMNQPLGHAVGNAMEVYECIEILRGEKNEKAAATLELSLELSAAMLMLSGRAESSKDARAKLQEALDSGAVLEKFRENLLAQGGDPAICDDPQKLLDNSLAVVPVKASGDGYLESIDTIAIGLAVCAIGGGRMKAEDKVDHAVGYLQEKKIGDPVRDGETLGLLYCRSENSANISCQKIANACKISPSEIEKTPLVLEEINEQATGSLTNL
jgi:pyrimidine-nucleoside phosphorylase